MTLEERRELYAMMRGIIASKYGVTYYGGWVHYQAESWPDGYCTFHAFEFQGTQLEAYRRAERDLRLRGNYKYREAYQAAWEEATERLGLNGNDKSQSPTTVSQPTPEPSPAGDYCAT